MNKEHVKGAADHAKGAVKEGVGRATGNERLADATTLYEQAAACKPADAMERLDVELARSELD